MFHIFHNWSKWEDIEKGNIVRQNFASLDPSEYGKFTIFAGIWIIQQSVCTTCGKKKLRKIRS